MLFAILGVKIRSNSHWIVACLHIFNCACLIIFGAVLISFLLLEAITNCLLSNMISGNELCKRRIYTFYCSLRENTQSFAWNGTNSAKIHSLARKYEHLGINQIQLRFLHFNQHSITLLGIHMGHWAYKREKYTFINANIKVINTILKVNRDNWHTLKCKHYSLTFLWHCLQFNSIPGQP